MPDHALSIRAQCALLDVHRSGYYYCPHQLYEDTILANKISEIHAQFPYYGYRKIHWVIQQEGILANTKKIRRLMKEGGICAIYPGPKTSIPGREETVHPYLLKGLEIDRPNYVWAVDITYIRLPVGMVYLFALIDWYSRYVVAHQLVNTMEAIHGVNTLADGLAKYGVPNICNADQGTQFTGMLWIEFLQSHNILISHDGVGRCIDNIRIERFWRTLKYEDVFLQSYETIQQARHGIGVFIQHYNHSRPHQALGYQTPAMLYLGGM